MVLVPGQIHGGINEDKIHKETKKCKRKWYMITVLISCGCCDKSPQTWLLKTKVYSLRSGGHKYKIELLAGLHSLGGFRGGTSFSLPGSGGCWEFLASGNITPLSASDFPLPSPLCMCLTALCLSLK